MLTQYSDKTSKSKSGSRLDKLSNTIKGENDLQQVRRCWSCYVPAVHLALPGYKS